MPITLKSSVRTDKIVQAAGHCFGSNIYKGLQRKKLHACQLPD